MMPLVSVIIPVYNGEKYILNMLEMLFHQSYKNIEIIIIDDGSKDCSFNIIEEYQREKEKKNLFFERKENKGVSSARNRGLEIAKGEFVVFVDCDDKIDSRYIEELVSNIIEQNCDLAICGYNVINENGDIIDYYGTKDILDKNQILNNLFLPNTIKCTLWNKIFKLNVIKKANLKFKENIYIGEDMIFLVEYIKCSVNFYCFNIPLYSYLKNQQGAMGTSHIEINERHLTEWDAIKKVKEELEQFEKVQDNLFKKQILIAHKIYRSIKKTNLDNNYKIELKNFLINNLNKLFLFKDLRLKTKISIFLNIIRN